MIVADERVAKFVADSLDLALCPPWTAMGLERDGEIVAGVVYNCFERTDVHVTAAGKGWTRGFLQAVGAYVYDTLRCGRMTFTTEQKTVADLAVRLGGQIEGRLRNHFGPGRDGLIVGILREEWRYAIGSDEPRG